MVSLNPEQTPQRGLLLFLSIKTTATVLKSIETAFLEPSFSTGRPAVLAGRGTLCPFVSQPALQVPCALVAEESITGTAGSWPQPRD